MDVWKARTPALDLISTLEIYAVLILMKRWKCVYNSIQATCSNLGIYDGEKYLPEPDCVECVKDLIRFLRYTTDKFQIFRSVTFQYYD